MYDYRQLIAEYLDAVAAGEGIQQAAGQLMKGLFEKGNVSLLSRPQVSGMTMTHAGWDNISENDTATVYTMWYSGGTDGVPWVEDVVLHMTPIMSNGTVKTPEQLDGYVDELLANNNSVDSLLEADKPSNGGFGLVICVQRAQEGWSKAHDEADIYDTALHQLQAAYYLNGTEDLPLGKDLMTIAGWYSTYKIYIKNYIGFDGEYTTNEDLVYTVPIAVNDEMNVFTEPKVTGDMGKAGSFEFGMQAGHPYYERLCQMKTIFRVVYDGDTIFRGRVLTVDTNHMNGNKQVHCEGDLAFLLDSQIEGVPDDKRTKSDALPYMSSLIAEHNSQMNEDMPDKKFELGEVPGAYSALTKDDQKVHPDGDYRYGSGSWRDSQSAWNDLTGSFGGFIRTRYQNGTCYIDWLDQYFRSGVNPQTIEIRENLIDLSSNSEVDNIFTAVIPVGSNNGKNLYINGYNGWGYNRILVPDITRFYSKEQLNQGFHTKSDYENAVKNYGIIYHTESFSNADTQAKLWEYALDWIKNNYIGSLYSFEVTALDMHLIGESSGKFLVGDKVNIIYPDSNRQDEDPEATIQKTLTIMGATYSLHDPSRNTYKIGVPNAVLKRNYGEKQKKKTSRASSSLSSQLADEANKQAEEVWEDTISTYDHYKVWGAILKDRVYDNDDTDYDNFITSGGTQQDVDKVEAIAEQWLYDTVNGLDSQYGSLPTFLASGFSTNADILALNQRERAYLRTRLVRAGNNGLPVWSKTTVTNTGLITEVQAAAYSYPAVVHSEDGNVINIRLKPSSNVQKIGTIPSDSTVWCNVRPEEHTGEWIQVTFGGKTGYIKSNFVVQCTGKYNQGTGYPELQETEKEEKVFTSEVFNSENSSLISQTMALISGQEKELPEGKTVGDLLPGVVMDADGNVQLGDNFNYLVNLLGGTSEINLGNGSNILVNLFGMGGDNHDTSGFEFFKQLPGELQQRIATAFLNGKTGEQTLMKQFFGGDDFTGINKLLSGLGLPLVTISADGTIELGTGDSSKPTTIKIDGNKGADGVENKYGWIGIKKSNDGELSWVIQLNDTVRYKNIENNWETATGFVSASDFKIPSIDSFKTKLGVFDQIVAGTVDAAVLTALKATIAETYIQQATIDEMFAGSAVTGWLNITGNGTNNIGLNVTGGINATGTISGGTVGAKQINVGESGLYFPDDDETASLKFVKIKTGSNTKTLGSPFIVSTGDLVIDAADIIGSTDAIVSIEKDNGLEDGKIGFKYTTISDPNANNHKVNFNIADTNYYKTRVGIKNATIESGDLEDYAGWDESVTFNGTDLKLESPYGLIEVFGNNTGETKNKYSIRLDASDIAGSDITMETNEVTIGEYVPPTANPRTDIQRYGKYDVSALATASDGSTKESETTELIPQAAWQAGFNSGQTSISEGEARNNGYIAGYNDAQLSSNVMSYVAELRNEKNAFYNKSKEQLLLEVTGTAKTQFRRLQNGSTTIESDFDKVNQSVGTPMTDQIPFSMKVVDTELYREDFANGKFVVKSKGDTGEVNIEGTKIDVPLKAALDIPIEGIINPVNNDTTTFTWNTNGDNKYKYTFTTTGSVTSNGTEIIPLSNANNVLDPALAIEHGQNKMGVKAASWKNNVVTFEVEESATKKQSLTIVSQPSYTYDKDTHKYKLSSSAYYIGNNNTNIAITGSSPEAGTYTTDDAAWQAGVAYAQANTPAPTVSVSVDPIDQMEYTETEGSLATSPETLNASGFYVVKANVNGTERVYKKFKTGAQGTSSNEKIEDNRSFGPITANGTGIEVKPSGTNTAMKKVTLNVAVPQRSATAIKGTGIGGIIPLAADDNGTPTKDVTVEYNGADASGSTTSQGSVTINAQPVYYSGQRSVKVLAVIRSENCDVDRNAKKATDDVTVYLDNGVTQMIEKVDFSDAFMVGYRREQHWLKDEDGNNVENTPWNPYYGTLTVVGDYSQNFTVELCDRQGNYVGEEDVSIDVSDIYTEGYITNVFTSEPSKPTYYYTSVNSLGEDYVYEGDDPVLQQIYAGFHGKNGTPFYKDDRLQLTYGNLHQGCEVQYLEKPMNMTTYWVVKYLDHTENGVVEYIGYISKENLTDVHYEPTGDRGTAKEKGAWFSRSSSNQSYGSISTLDVKKVIVNSAVHSRSSLSKDNDILVVPKNGGKGYLSSKVISDDEYSALKVSSTAVNGFFEKLKTGYYGRHLIKDTSSDMLHKIHVTVEYANRLRKEGIIEIQSYAAMQLSTYEYEAKVYDDSGISCNIYNTEGTYGDIIATIPNDATARFKDDPYGYPGLWIAVQYGDAIGYMEAKYVVGTVEFMKLHPDYNEKSELKTITVVEVVHAAREYDSNVITTMGPIGSASKSYMSTALADEAYDLRPTFSDGMPDEIVEIMNNFGRVFTATHASGEGVPLEMHHNVKMLFTYSDGRTVGNKYMEITSKGKPKISYVALSSIYTKNGMRVNLRTGPSKSAPRVPDAYGGESVLIPNGTVIYLQKNPSNITEDWAAVQYKDGVGNVYSGYAMSMYIKGTPAYYEYIATDQSGNPIKITSLSVNGIFHDKAIKNGSVEIKFRWDDDYFKYDSGYYSKATSLNTTANIYKGNFKTNADPGDYMTLLNSSHSVYAYHNMSTYSGYLKHKVEIKAHRSDGTDKYYIVEITSQPVYQSAYTMMKTV